LAGAAQPQRIGTAEGHDGPLDQRVRLDLQDVGTAGEDDGLAARQAGAEASADGAAVDDGEAAAHDGIAAGAGEARAGAGPDRARTAADATGDGAGIGEHAGRAGELHAGATRTVIASEFSG